MFKYILALWKESNFDKMAIIAKENRIGAWAFLIGIILAVIIGLSTTLFSIPALTAYSKPIYAILVLLGLVVGWFTNTEGKEAQTFLLAGAILVVVSKYGMEGVTGSIIGIGVSDAAGAIFGALLALFTPATIVVAIKTVFSITRV